MKQEQRGWQPPAKSVTLQQIDEFVAKWARHRSAGQVPAEIVEAWKQLEYQQAAVSPGSAS